MNILVLTEEKIDLTCGNPARITYIYRALNNLGIKIKLIGRTTYALKYSLFEEEGRFSKYMFRIYLIISLFLKSKPKYIITIELYMGIYAIILSKIFKIKSIYNFQGFVFEEQIYQGQKYKPILIKFLEKICLKYSDYIITITNGNVEKVKKINRNVFLLPNGIDLLYVKKFISNNKNKNILKKYKIPVNKPLIGFVGNWEKWMRIEDLLDASRYLDNKNVVIIGSSLNIEIFKKKYPKVIFTGRIPRDATLKILNSFDICVLPYSKDPIMKYKSAMKTYEYLAAGKPIIVSDVVGKEDFLVESKNCLTYKSENPKDLAYKIKILLKDENLRKELEKNNKELVKEFSWEKAVEKSGLLEIFREDFK